MFWFMRVSLAVATVLVAAPGCGREGDGDGDADALLVSDASGDAEGDGGADADVDGDRHAGSDSDTDGGGADGDADDDGYLPAESYCERIVELFCSFYVRCGRMAVDDAASCREPFLESCNGRYERRYIALEAAGLLRLSAAGVDACSEHLGEVDCNEQLRDLAGPCQTMWEGAQPEGGPCGLDVESFVCAPGTECVLDMSLCGTCERLLPEGASCPVDGATCGAAADCLVGTCRVRPRVGDSCLAGETCELGATCDGSTCVPRTSIVSVGDVCDATHRCPYSARCASGICQPTARLGEPCAIDADCDAGSCDETGTCVALLDSGSPCERREQCATGACDDGSCAGLPSACFEP